MKFFRERLKVDKNKIIEVNSGFRKRDKKTLNYDNFDYSIDDDKTRVVNFYYYLRFKKGKYAIDDLTHRMWNDSRNLEIMAKRFSFNIQNRRYNKVEGRFIISLRIPEGYLLQIKAEPGDYYGEMKDGSYKN